MDRADEDRNRDLLRDVDPQELYEAGLTVMMRLVFLLAAEERGLLLLGDPRYDSFYAVSTLRMQLRTDCRRDLRASAVGMVSTARSVPWRLWRHRTSDPPPPGTRRLALRSRSLSLSRRAHERDMVAQRSCGTAADRRPDGLAPARSDPDLRRADAILSRARRGTDRPRL